MSKLRWQDYMLTGVLLIGVALERSFGFPAFAFWLGVCALAAGIVKAATT